MCLDVGVLCITGVGGADLLSTHLVYLCVCNVCTQVHAHGRELKEREHSGQAFRLTLVNHSMRCQYPPKVSIGLLYLPSLGSFSFQSPHIGVPDGGQAQCLARWPLQ